MEIKVHSRDKLFLIFAVLGFISFFLPWIVAFGQHSGYDIMSLGNEIGNNQSWILILIPISFLIVVLSKLQIIKIINPTLLKVIEVIPLVILILTFTKLFRELGIKVEDIGQMDKDFFKIFKFGFPLTLISSIGIIFSPLNKQVISEQKATKTNNLSQNSDHIKEHKQSGKNFSLTVTILSNSFTKIFNWLKGNPKIFYFLGIGLILLFVVWLLFIKEYPKKDAKNLASELCKCYNTYEQETEEAYIEYLSTFDDQNFLKRIEAKNSLNSIRNPINSKKHSCIEVVNNKLKIIKGKFNYENRKKFELAYIENQNNCSNTNNSKISSLYSEIEKKIESIQDPEPNNDKIKGDLIGNKIPGWNFDYLSEFKEFKILNKIKNNIRIEYDIKMELLDEKKNSIHDCEVKIVYLLGNNGWYFSSVKMKYITYINTGYPNKWTKITPLKDCKYSVFDLGNKYWIRDGLYGKKYKGGPDGETYYLKSSTVYLMSRENRPITVEFKYKPKK